MKIKVLHVTDSLVMRVRVEEVWENEYLIKAANVEEAAKKIENGSLGKNYFAETKQALPKRFVRFVE